MCVTKKGYYNTKDNILKCPDGYTTQNYNSTSYRNCIPSNINNFKCDEGYRWDGKKKKCIRKI